MVPIAHANDGGGSTRIPAACCGLVGLKPQRGRISLAPEAGEAYLVQDGVLTRTVNETAQLLDVLAGYVLGDASWAPPPAEPFAAQAAREPVRKRIAFTTLPPIPDTEVDPVCAEAVHDAAALLESLGHEVVEADPPWQDASLLETFTANFGPALSTQIAFIGLVNGREPTEADMEPLSWAIYQLSKGIDSVQASLATFALHGVARALITWMSDYDFVLTPSLAEAPVTHNTIDPCSATPLADFARSGQFTPFTAGMNITGSPAISLPLYHRDDLDLPVGVQIIGQPAGEGELLALSAQIEAALPWAERRAQV
jgi:amidase